MPSYFLYAQTWDGGAPDSLAWDVGRRAGLDHIAGVVGQDFL
jgi:hypothetical protein